MALSVMPPPAGDFVNDIIIVCTLAIVIGQNLRADLKEAVECKRRDIREHVARLPKGDLITNEESIRTLYDWIKNFCVLDLIKFMGFFYICIFVSVFLDLISINQHLKLLKYCLELNVEPLKFCFEIIVWLSLIFYGLALMEMRRLFNVFMGRTYNLFTSLDLVSAGLNMGNNSNSSNTDTN